MLARRPNVRLATRTCGGALSGGATSMPGPSGQALQVGYVLQGTLWPVGQRVRVQAWLINSADGSEVWRDSFEREAHDVLAMLDSLTERHRARRASAASRAAATAILAGPVGIGPRHLGHGGLRTLPAGPGAAAGSGQWRAPRRPAVRAGHRPRSRIRAGLLGPQRRARDPAEFRRYHVCRSVLPGDRRGPAGVTAGFHSGPGLRFAGPGLHARPPLGPGGQRIPARAGAGSGRRLHPHALRAVSHLHWQAGLRGPGVRAGQVAGSHVSASSAAGWPPTSCWWAGGRRRSPRSSAHWNWIPPACRSR